MTTRPRRRGIAPLEFVLVFPMLLSLTVALFLMARADMAKSFSASDARHRAWLDRSAVPPGHPLVITAEVGDSLASHTTTKLVPPGPVFPNNFRAESRNTVFANPWDHRDVPFDRGHPNFEPHLAELGMVAGQVPLLAGILRVGLGASAYALDPARNFALLGAAALGRGANVLVVLAGKLLANVGIPALRAAQTLIRIAMIPLRVAAIFSRSARRLLRYLQSVVDMIDVGITAAGNLHEASRGRPGHWDPNLVRRLANFSP